MARTVNVYLNDCPEHAFRAFDPEHCQLGPKPAVTYEAKDTVDTDILEDAFEQLNVGSRANPVVKRYRDAGNRSLSVGDVVEIDGVQHLCLPSGWKQLP